MTSIPVKGVRALFANMATAQAGKNNVGGIGFQDIWSSQMNKNALESSSQESAAGAAARQGVSGEQLNRGSSLKVRQSQTVEEDGENAQISPEFREEIMEMLGTEALQLMQEIADAFGITLEELQTVMEGLDMGQMDVLDAAKLSTLLLNLGGAEDLSALITNGELYDNYRMIMDRLENVLQESAQAFEIEPEQLESMLRGNLEQDTAMPGDVELAEGPAAGLSEPIAVERQEVKVSDETMAGQEPTENPEIAGEAVQKGEEAQEQGDSQPREEGRHSQGKAEKEPQLNPFLQNLRAEQFQPGAGQVQSAASPWSENTQNIMNQIMDYMKLQLNADTTNLEMQLHPENLGTLQIHLVSKAGAVTANFVAENETVKAALETQMIQLKEQFAEQGIKVEAIEVTVQTHEFERNLDEQGRGRQQQAEKKGRGRRGRVNGSLAMEAAEAEDLSVADRMAAGSSTVEYTA